MIHVAEKNYFPDFSQYMRSMTNVSETQSIGEIWDIQSTEEWQEIRMMRNRFAHDYPDDWSKNSALINWACEVAAEMYRFLIGIENKLRTECSGHVLGKSLPEFVLSKTPKIG